MSDLSQTVRAIGLPRLAVMAAVFFSLIVFFVYMTTRLSTPDMAVLYSDLAPEDAGAISGRLQELGIPYEATPDGTTIKVDKPRLAEARLALAQEGLPGGGSVGYEIFDQDQSLGMAQDILDIKKKRALQGELERTIESLKPVADARVHIVFADRAAFSTETTAATATVTLRLRTTLGADQVAAVQHLVAAAVPRLEPDQVRVFDQQGRMLSRQAGDEALDGGIGGRKDERRRARELELVRKIEQVLGPIVGPQRVRAEVTADMNFDRETVTSREYDIERQVALSVNEREVRENENESEPTDEVTVENQLPAADTPAGATAATANRQRSETETTTNNVIPHTDRTIEKETGIVSRLSVSVAIDGTYTVEPDGTTTYRPRSDEEMEIIRRLVERAIGFDEGRGDVLEVTNLPFYEASLDPVEEVPETIAGFERDTLMSLAETVVLGLVAILVVLLVVRPLLSRVMDIQPIDPTTLASSASEEGMTPLITHDGNIKLIPDKSLEAKISGMTMEQRRQIERMVANGTAENVEDALDQMINIAQVEGRTRSNSLSKIQELVEKHPDEAVGIIRGWMYQEG